MDQNDLDNRFTYHPPKLDQTGKYEKVRAEVKRIAEIFDELAPDSREKSLAITHLEEAVFWANAAIARNT